MKTDSGANASEEIFDVVNAADEVVGRQPRSEVHRLGLRHRAVHILVFNQKGEVFLQKRSMSKDTWPGAWDSSASGHLASGETYDAAAVRELKEELGLEISGQRLVRLFKIDACVETGEEFVWIYRLEDDGPFRWDLDEIEVGDWFHSDQIDRWIQKTPSELASAFRLIWARVRKGSSGEESGSHVR